MSILSERRARGPYGLNGGACGAPGLNLWIKQTHGESGKGKPRVINIGGKGTMQFETGDLIVLHTPGGGGWGKLEDTDSKLRQEDEPLLQARKWEARGSWADMAKVDF